MLSLNRAKEWIDQHSQKILWAAIVLYGLFFFVLGVLKYNAFGYNALDLGIYNQVFYNSAHGHLFNFTIHPHSYLGDHFELFIIFLLPFYLLWQSPLMLLLLQTLFLSVAAWPLYLIAREKIGKRNALFFCLIFLFSPLIQNINAFEFHLLPFSIFFLFWAYYFYERKSFFYFTVCSIAALLIREDVALVVLMFSALAFLEKRRWRWRIVPFALGLGWFMVALKAASLLNQYGQYKFFYYYQWLGANWPEALANIVAGPTLIFQHLFSLDNGVLLLALLILFAGLPLLRPKVLLLAVFPLAQLLFAGFSKVTVLETHYTSLLIVPLFIAAVLGFSALTSQKRGILMIVLATITLYSVLTLGPMTGLVGFWQNREIKQEMSQLKNQFASRVPATASVVATYEFLTKLSARPEIYSLHYVFRGTKQYSPEKYELPSEVRYALIDANDFLTYQMQFSKRDFYAEGDNRVRRVLEEKNFGLTQVIDSLTLWERGISSSLRLYEKVTSPAEIAVPLEKSLGGQIRFLGSSHPELKTAAGFHILDISLYWQALAPLEKNYQIELTYLNQAGQSLSTRLYPLAYGLYPTSQWPLGETIKTNQRLYVPKPLINEIRGLRISLVDIKGYLGLDKIKSAAIKITDKRIVGTPFIISL